VYLIYRLVSTVAEVKVGYLRRARCECQILVLLKPLLLQVHSDRSRILRGRALAFLLQEPVAFQRPWMRMLIELHLVHSLKSLQVS